MRQQTIAVERKLANIRAVIENGVSDMTWAHARLEELHAERARRESRRATVPVEPPTVGDTALARHTSGLPRVLEKATDHARRELVRQFVARIGLDPETREVELQLRLPGKCVDQLEAARLPYTNCPEARPQAALA